jgi:hypothetical protein
MMIRNGHTDHYGDAGKYLLFRESGVFIPLSSRSYREAVVKVILNLFNPYTQLYY